MKRVFRRGSGLGVTAVVAALALTACGGSTSTTESSAPASTATSAVASAPAAADVTGTVRVLMEGVPDTDVVKALLPEFNKVYPGVTVEIETAAYDQMRDKYVASFQAPEPTYDMAIVDNPWMYDFAQAGFL
ncbi:MAG: extracellular solute-binding protein, partial [Actinobacteria bacterium]|nr:extracellular solute-binding protein [Actinomycetota bacterium]